MHSTLHYWCSSALFSTASTKQAIYLTLICTLKSKSRTADQTRTRRARHVSLISTVLARASVVVGRISPLARVLLQLAAPIWKTTLAASQVTDDSVSGKLIKVQMPWQKYTVRYSLLIPLGAQSFYR